MTTTTNHSLKVGDILHSSWGYDQTNATFFQVTALNGKTMVTVEQIGKRSVKDPAAGTPAGVLGVVPEPDSFYTFSRWYRDGKAVERNPMRRKVHYGDGVHINSYMWATKCDPTKPKYDTIAMGYPGH